jgi:hypothetical protein
MPRPFRRQLECRTRVLVVQVDVVETRKGSLAGRMAGNPWKWRRSISI